MRDDIIEVLVEEFEVSQEDAENAVRLWEEDASSQHECEGLVSSEIADYIDGHAKYWKY